MFISTSSFRGLSGQITYSRPITSYLVKRVRTGASQLQSLEAARELLSGEVGELVERQGEGVLALGVLLHVLLHQNLVVGVHLEKRTDIPV